MILAELENRPVAGGIEVDELVRHTEGMTPAAIENVIDTAALDVFKRAAETGRRVELDTEHLVSAIERYGGQDRPTVEHWTWESLVLPPAVKAQLQQLQAVIEDPESARRFGVDPPTGLLLASARENRPSIVFIDEIDAIAPRRGASASTTARSTSCWPRSTA